MLDIALALVVGVGFGYLASRWWSARRSTGAEPPPRSADVSDDGHTVAADLAVAVDHLEIGVVIAAPTGRVVYRNTAAAAYGGTHVGLLLDDHLTSILEESRSGQRVQRTVELLGPPHRWIELAADPLPDGGAVSTIRDVTERVRADSMRTDFVTNISHELKTPVGAVAVLAEALIDETDPDVVHRLTDRLVEESHRAVRTIDDLLKLSQIESGRADDAVVDLGNVIRTAIARGRVVDGGRGVQISAFDNAENVRVLGDERQLTSAVGNLVENAVKYSGPNDVVQVRLRRDDRAVEIMVADQGVGIPSRDLDRIFERFYRVDKARSRETGGTGLGLSIVRHVATNHGGEVVVSSQEGEGSTFVLRLPADLVVEPDQPRPEMMNTPDTSDPSDAG